MGCNSFSARKNPCGEETYLLFADGVNVTSAEAAEVLVGEILLIDPVVGRHAAKLLQDKQTSLRHLERHDGAIAGSGQKEVS